MSESTPVERSYRYCRRLTRAAARNFYYAIFLLPKAKRDALCALYAFMRRADDISDTPGDAATKLEQMNAWRSVLDAALAGQVAADPALPALHHAVRTFGVPARYLHDLISGTEMDLGPASYDTFAALREYCYRVAGAVGLCCIHVFGFRDSRAPELAERLGIAFQLTNILRDVKADHQMGRVYLPGEDLRRFGCTPQDLGSPLAPAARQLMQFESERAWQFYAAGNDLLPMIDEDSRPALWALMRIYSGILRGIESREYDVFSRGVVRLSTAHKVAVMLKAWLGFWKSEKAIEDRNRDRRGTGRAGFGRHAG